MQTEFPRMVRVRQRFPDYPAFDITSRLEEGFKPLLPPLKAGCEVAIAVGSRGISNLREIVREVIRVVKGIGARPFIIPAMGSHGGATPEGQRDLLASYGITEANLNVPIRDSLEVRQIGISASGVPVYCSVEALRAEAIIVINRVKPHTDFNGKIASGPLKMCVIGLGKRDGATAMHRAAGTLGYERMIREMARVVLNKAPVLCGVAILENEFHQTAAIDVVPREQIETREEELLVKARSMLAVLPFEELDLLIVDRIGKNISGAGMDPNVTGRWVHGYSSSLSRENDSSPFIRRIFVRDLTPETHGNAIGIGMADITTKRLVQAMDQCTTYVNALTALTPQAAKIPIYFDTDAEALEQALRSAALPEPKRARIARIHNTLDLEEMFISEVIAEEYAGTRPLQRLGDLEELVFQPDGNLTDWAEYS